MTKVYFTLKNNPLEPGTGQKKQYGRFNRSDKRFYFSEIFHRIKINSLKYLI